MKRIYLISVVFSLIAVAAGLLGARYALSCASEVPPGGAGPASPSAAPASEKGEPGTSAPAGPDRVPSGPHMIIVQPGYPGSTADARDFMLTLCEYVGGKAKLSGLSGEYHNETPKALAAVESLKPAVGIVSTGFYLEQRRRLGLKVLLQSKPKDNFLVVTRKGEVKDLAALKGQIVTGGPLHESPYLERIVFPGKVDVASWQAKPTLFASRALRDLLERKRCQAIVITGRDLKGFAEVYPAKLMDRLLESEGFPPAFLVAFGAPPEAKGAAPGAKEDSPSAGKPPEAAEAASPAGAPLSKESVEGVVKTFSGLPGDPQGRAILQTMGAEGFEEVPADWLAKLEGMYDAAEKK